MATTLAVFAVLVIALSLYGVKSPVAVLQISRRFMVSPGIWVAAAIRLLLAVLFWFAAPVSMTPVAFRVLALLVLAAALTHPLVGTERLLKLVDRVESWPNSVVRLQGLVGIGFAAFILWSLWPAVVA